MSAWLGGKALAWLVRSPKGAAGLILVLALLLGCGLYACQAGQIRRLQTDNAVLVGNLREAAAANRSRDAALAALERARRDDADILTRRDEELYALRQELARKAAELDEAGRRDPDYQAWSPQPLPDVVRELLGRGPGTDSADGSTASGAPGGAPARLPRPGVARPR